MVTELAVAGKFVAKVAKRHQQDTRNQIKDEEAEKAGEEKGGVRGLDAGASVCETLCGCHINFRLLCVRSQLITCAGVR